MRKIVPPNISRTNLQTMISSGMDSTLAEYVWNTKILWLLCMHADDLPKVHIADLRSKYIFQGLDIVEMRAIWHILPSWSPDDENSRDKFVWKMNFKAKLDELAKKEEANTLTDVELRGLVYRVSVAAADDHNDI